MKAIANLATTLAKTLKEYAIEPITTSRVRAWVSQFPEKFQETILKEMIHIYHVYFWDKDWFKERISRCINDAQAVAKKKGEGILDLRFLNIQESGKSQQDILDIADDILSRKHGLHIDACGGGATAIYIDDCTYTGNKLHRDVARWAQGSADLEGISSLYTYLLSYYNGNIQYSTDKAREACRSIGVSYRFKHCKKLENKNLGSTELQCYAPANELGIGENTNVEAYTKELESDMHSKGRIFPYWRKHVSMGKEKVFSSKKNRLIVEGLFLIKGCEYHKMGHVQNRNLRPMGYHFFNTLGFGAINVSYRNIPNNAPLVLWWSAQGQTALFEPARWS